MKIRSKRGNVEIGAIVIMFFLAMIFLLLINSVENYKESVERIHELTNNKELSAERKVSLINEECKKALKVAK